MNNDEPKSNVIPFRPRRSQDSVPIISSDYWADTFPLLDLLAAIDSDKLNKKLDGDNK